MRHIGRYGTLGTAQLPIFSVGLAHLEANPSPGPIICGQRVGSENYKYSLRCGGHFSGKVSGGLCDNSDSVKYKSQSYMYTWVSHTT